MLVSGVSEIFYKDIMKRVVPQSSMGVTCANFLSQRQQEFYNLPGKPTFQLNHFQNKAFIILANWKTMLLQI